MPIDASYSRTPNTHADGGLKAALPAKLIQPYRPATQVYRPWLYEALLTDQCPKVSLVRAPAGFGKSTLLQQAYSDLKDQGVAVAWLSFDHSDNDVPRLLHFLGRALESLTSQHWEITSDVAAGTLALELFDRIATLDHRFMLFFDDLESLQNPVALALVRQLIDHIGPLGRVAIGSRSLPDIGLSKLRCSGQLLEIDSEKLRFSLPETQQFLHQHNAVTLEHHWLERLHHTSEGWPAAIGLASLLLDGAEDPAMMIQEFSGSSALVADYLGEEVLARQSQTLREFLLCTSILPQLSAPLCDAMLGIQNSRHLLVELERSHLFLVPLDSERRWFRYHSLFADFLREQLPLVFPNRVASLHKAAAQWYLDQHRPVPAIEHLLKSTDMDAALSLFNQHAQRLLGQGRALLLSRLLACADESVLARWPDLQVVHIWALAFTSGSSEAMPVLAKYEALESAGLGGGGDSSACDEQSVDGHLALNATALRPMLLSMLDRHDEAREVALLGMERVSHEHCFPHAILRTSLAYVTLVMGEPAQAQTLLDEGRRLMVIDQSPFTQIYAQCVEGVIELLQGRLRQAASRFRTAAGAQDACGRFATNGNAMAAILLSEALYDMGELVECERLLKVYVPLMQMQGVPDHLICGHRILARLYAQRGDMGKAFEQVNELEYYGQRNGLPRLVACARLERARFCVFAGDALAAADELSRAKSDVDWGAIERWCLFACDIE